NRTRLRVPLEEYRDRNQTSPKGAPRKPYGADPLDGLHRLNRFSPVRPKQVGRTEQTDLAYDHDSPGHCPNYGRAYQKGQHSKLELVERPQQPTLASWCDVRPPCRMCQVR